MKKLLLVLMLMAGMGWCSNYDVDLTTVTLGEPYVPMSKFKALEARVKKLEDKQPKCYAWEDAVHRGGYAAVKRIEIPCEDSK